MKKLFLVSTTWLLCTLFGYGQSIESRYTYWLIHRIVLFHRGMNCLLIQETIHTTEWAFNKSNLKRFK